MNAHFSVRELAPAFPRKFFLSPIVINGYRKVKPIRVRLLRICLGFSIHLLQSDDMSSFRIHTRSGRLF